MGHEAETRADAEVWRESDIVRDGRFPLAEHASATCSKSITFLLKPAPLLGFERIQTLSRALKAAGCSQTITMRYNPRHCWVFLLL